MINSAGNLLKKRITKKGKLVRTEKDKIANKVSEIRKKNNKAISGFVLSNDGNKMKINNNGEENQVKFDDTLTKYLVYP